MKTSVRVLENQIVGWYCRWGREPEPQGAFLPAGWYDVMGFMGFDGEKVLLAENLSDRRTSRPTRYQPSQKHLYWCKKKDVAGLPEIRWS